jgi:hypothetical protein
MQSVSETTRRQVSRRRICLALAAATAAVGAVPPATGNHSLLHLGAGGLSVSQPASAHLGTASTGAAGLQAPLGTVTVTDTRNLSLGGYTVQVIGSPFTTTSNGVTYAIPAANIRYTPPVTIGGTGTATRTPGAGGTLDQSRIAVTATLVVGNNTSTWNPTITVIPPADAVAGVYTGTIAHSVA